MTLDLLLKLFLHDPTERQMESYDRHTTEQEGVFMVSVLLNV